MSFWGLPKELGGPPRWPGERGALHAAYLHCPPVPRAIPVTEGDFDLLTYEAQLPLNPAGSGAGSPRAGRSAGTHS